MNISTLLTNLHHRTNKLKTNPHISDSTIKRKRIKYRRNLLPLWIKIFIWFFLITGISTPILLIFGLFDLPSGLAIYNLEANNIYSPIGLLLATIYIFKAVVAFGLWFGKDWAIILGLIDTIIGILICMMMMALPIINMEVHFYPKDVRVELLLLIPFLCKLSNIKQDWFDETKYRTYLEV